MLKESESDWEARSDFRQGKTDLYSWVNKHDHLFAPIQSKPDWKDRLIACLSLPMLTLVIYFAITNPR